MHSHGFRGHVSDYHNDMQVQCYILKTNHWDAWKCFMMPGGTMEHSSSKIVVPTR